MAANYSSPSVANGVGVGCNRASKSARSDFVAAIVELPEGKRQLLGKTPLLWLCVLLGYVECIRGEIGSGQGPVQGTIH